MKSKIRNYINYNLISFFLRCKNLGVIIDKNNELPWMLVVSKSPLLSLSYKEEVAMVSKAIQKHPKFIEAASEEISRAFEVETWKCVNPQSWNDSFRLHFYPVTVQDVELFQGHDIKIVFI